MPNVVKILRSTTAGNTPSALASGQIAINETDGKLFYRNGSGAVTLFAPAATISDGTTYDCGAYSAIAPAAPTGLTVTPSTGQAALSWVAPANNGGAAVTDYSIQYSNDSGSTYTSFSHTASSNATATITGLTTGSYLFRVAAINSVGTGSYVTSSSTSISASGAAAFSSQNATWSALFSSGAGSVSSPYTRTGAYATNFAGAQATVVASGTVRITGAMFSDFGVDVFKNGSTTNSYTIADANSGGGGTYTLNGTITVSAGDTIRLGIANSDGYSLNAGQTINVWWL